MSSKRTVLSRPRTKLYDANYNIGESYYKSALDRLDRKYSGRPLTPPRQTTPLGDLAERHARIFADEDLETSRRRAEKHIKQDHVFDSRGARISRAGALLATMENDIDDETAASIRHLRAKKKVSIIDDVDLESTSNNLKTNRLLGRSEKILDSVGINENSARRMLEDDTAMKRRALKVTFEPEADDLTKWTPLENNVSSVRSRREEVRSVRSKVADDSSYIRSESGAALRAKQSRERLSDIEDEMAAMAEKQAAREARVARLRALVAETEQESAEFELSQAKAERASARKEQRSEHF
ncbi:uncharacterized protein [Leptinotarsa decemlineata]|uniref:uncharacterized protein n=1 Tax=Leptinotarsa decemlineata TaxID=7539 RepID=UPI000C252B90|nr:uncharacterized protein LOC111514857 [Leptinotarsa decemlineata]